MASVNLRILTLNLLTISNYLDLYTSEIFKYSIFLTDRIIDMMIKSFRTYILSLCLLAMFSSLANSDEVNTVKMVSEGLSKINSTFKYTCGVETQEVVDCPYMVEQFNQDRETGFFFSMISDSPWKSCQRTITSSSFISSKELENKLSTEDGRDLGITPSYFNSQIDKCFKRDDVDSSDSKIKKKVAISMSYNYLNKIKNNTHDLSKEIANINSILGNDILDDIPCGEFNMPHDRGYCLSLSHNKCKAHGGLKKISDDLYDQAIEPIYALALKMKEIRRRYSGRGMYGIRKKKLDEITPLIEFIKAENPILRGDEASSFIDKIISRAKLPSRDEFSTNLKEQFKSNKSLLKDKLKKNISMNHCILYGDSSECSDFDEDYARIPYRSTPMSFKRSEIESNGSRKKQLAREELYQLPECIDRSRNLKNEFNSFALDFSMNVGLTVLTGGAGLALRAGQLGKVALAARAATLGADAAFLGKGVNQAIDSCNKELNGLEEISKQSSKNICPISIDGPGYVKTSNVKGCVTAALLASVDALPFVPAIASRAAKPIPKAPHSLNNNEQKELNDFINKYRSGKEIQPHEQARYLALLKKTNPLDRTIKKGLPSGEREFTEKALFKMFKQEELSADELLRLSKNLKPRNPPLVIVTAQNDMDKILGGKRIWGRTEGRVYASHREMDGVIDKLRTGVHDKKEGTIIFSGDTAALFKPHEVKGLYSAYKRIAGQQRGPFGDIVIEEFKKEMIDGKLVVVITKARRAKDSAHTSEVLHQGQSTFKAARKVAARVVTLDGALTTGLPAFLTWLHLSDTDSSDKLFDAALSTSDE